MVGIPVIVVTSYALYGRRMGVMTSMYNCLGLILLVVLGQEQKPLSALPEGPLHAKDV